MDVSSLKTHVSAADISMDRLEGNTSLTQDQKIGEASRQFEAIMLRQILESAQKTVIKSKFADTTATSSVYRDMVTSQLADSISKSGAFGLAQTFQNQLQSKAPGGSDEESDATEISNTGASPAAANVMPLARASQLMTFHE